MSSYVVARAAAVPATVTMVQRTVPGTAGHLAAVADVTLGHDRARAVARADSSLPLCIWSILEARTGQEG